MIHPFKPEPAEFQRLNSLYKNNPNYILNNEALGTREGRLNLNILKHHGQSSFHHQQPDSHWFPHHRIEDGTLVDMKEVKVVSFEHYITDLLHNDIMIPNFIKTDTEGYDLEVVRSYGLHLPQIYALRTEMHFERAFKDGLFFSDFDRWFTDHDYFLLNIDYSDSGVSYSYFTPNSNRYGILYSSEAVYLRNYEFLRSLLIAKLLVLLLLFNNYTSGLAVHLLLKICSDESSLRDQLLTGDCQER